MMILIIGTVLYILVVSWAVGTAKNNTINETHETRTRLNQPKVMVEKVTSHYNVTIVRSSIYDPLYTITLYNSSGEKLFQESSKTLTESKVIMVRFEVDYNKGVVPKINKTIIKLPNKDEIKALKPVHDPITGDVIEDQPTIQCNVCHSHYLIDSWKYINQTCCNKKQLNQLKKYLKETEQNLQPEMISPKGGYVRNPLNL